MGTWWNSRAKKRVDGEVGIGGVPALQAFSDFPDPHKDAKSRSPIWGPYTTTAIKGYFTGTPLEDLLSSRPGRLGNGLGFRGSGQSWVQAFQDLTWRFMGSHKWGYKSHNMDYNYSYLTYNLGL